ncbi:hypothetical protein NDU88_010819 [Pleurodeles waltl]|uniref:Uncharacterized protein n=1 Tax=Pleurodeles waltl TaxID=8319 RepID=A0AAV7QZ71_PLEWA|nr:hypothetical protein NDU88_010819 [Pleurodeles waltl]
MVRLRSADSQACGAVLPYARQPHPLGSPLASAVPQWSGPSPPSQQRASRRCSRPPPIRAPFMGLDANTAAHVAFTAQGRASPTALFSASLMPSKHRQNVYEYCGSPCFNHGTRWSPETG